MTDDGKLSLRQYLLFRVLEDLGETVHMPEYEAAIETVESVAKSHPDWDLDARQDWAGWEKWVKREEHEAKKARKKAKK